MRARVVETTRADAQAAAGGASGDISPLDPFSRLREKVARRASRVLPAFVVGIHAAPSRNFCLMTEAARRGWPGQARP